MAKLKTSCYIAWQSMSAGPVLNVKWGMPCRYENTEKRQKEVAAKGLMYFGMGVSGGEEGARNGEVSRRESGICRHHVW